MKELFPIALMLYILSDFVDMLCNVRIIVKTMLYGRLDDWWEYAGFLPKDLLPVISKYHLEPLFGEEFNSDIIDLTDYSLFVHDYFGKDFRDMGVDVFEEDCRWALWDEIYALENVNESIKNNEPIDRIDMSGHPWEGDDERPDFESHMADLLNQRRTLLRQENNISETIQLGSEFLAATEHLPKQLNDLKSAVITALGLKPAAVHRCGSDPLNYYLVFEVAGFKFYLPVSKEWIEENVILNVPLSEEVISEEFVWDEKSPEMASLSDIPDIETAVEYLLDFLGLSAEQKNSFKAQ